MKIRLPGLLLLSAGILSVVAGCNTIAGTNTATQIDSTSPQTIISSPTANTPGITESPTTAAVTTLPISTDKPSSPASLPDAAVYPPIVDGIVTVILGDGVFSPVTIQIPVGTTVEWQVTDHLVDHAIYDEDGMMWGPVIYWIPFRKTFDTPGTYHYYDADSQGGKGTVIVY